MDAVFDLEAMRVLAQKVEAYADVVVSWGTAFLYAKGDDAYLVVDYSGFGDMVAVDLKDESGLLGMIQAICDDQKHDIVVLLERAKPVRPEYATHVGKFWQMDVLIREAIAALAA